MSIELWLLLCLVVAIWASAIYFLVEDLRVPPQTKEPTSWRKWLLVALIAAGLVLQGLRRLGAWFPTLWMASVGVGASLMLLLYLVLLPFLVFAIRGEKLLKVVAIALWLVQFTWFVSVLYLFIAD